MEGPGANILRDKVTAYTSVIGAGFRRLHSDQRIDIFTPYGTKHDEAIQGYTGYSAGLSSMGPQSILKSASSLKKFLQTGAPISTLIKKSKQKVDDAFDLSAPLKNNVYSARLKAGERELEKKGRISLETVDEFHANLVKEENLYTGDEKFFRALFGENYYS